MRIPMLILSLAVLSSTNAEEMAEVQKLMAVSKMAGVCGVMQQMGKFQSATKMPNGDAFIERFWQTEFARLGKTQAQFFKECEFSISEYEQFWQLTDQAKR